MRLLSSLLKAFITKGTLVVFDAKGGRHDFVGTPTTPVITMRLHNASLYHKLLLQPDLTAAEAYMDGTLTFEDGTDIISFLDPSLGLLRQGRRNDAWVYRSSFASE